MGKVVVRFRRTIVAIIIAGILLVFVGWSVDRLILPGLSSARSVPPADEIAIASWLLHASVPAKEALRVNPLPATAENTTAGAQIFQRHCAICHGYDGSGANTIGRGEYPPVPPLGSPSIAAQSDGELFYHIRNGIRYTGMPAWDLPAPAIWQAILFIRHLPVTATLPRAAAAQNVTISSAAATETPHYVGSSVCATCHRDIFARWNKTRMAHVVSDPRAFPGTVVADLASAPAAMKPSLGDADLVYGSRWKQRFFKKIGNDYYVLPLQWDIVHQRWLKYFVAEDEDWWAQLYPPDNFKRPTGPLCDGCHSVNYDIQTHTVTEWNVGCERCHGPGSRHLADPRRETIINPARLDAFAADDTCIQCHSQGRPRDNPIAGQYYDWPVGFTVGKRLADVWRLERRHPGITDFYFFADGTAHKNRMQGNDFVQSLMYRRGVTCFSCHDPHGSDNPSMLRAKGNDLCLSCHGANTQNGPHAETIAAHTHHRPDSAGSACTACHMPSIERQLGDAILVHAHTFRFIPPAVTEVLGTPNPCTLCHTDKTVTWARTELDHWQDRSPWRDAP